MFTKHITSSDREASPFQCFFCPSGCVCLRWRRTLLLHFSRSDLERIIGCLEDILSQPSRAFSMGAGPFCACHAADGQYYLQCQDCVVLRLSEEEARSLHGALASTHTVVNHLSADPSV